MRIENRDVKLTHQGQENDEIRKEIDNLLKSMGLVKIRQEQKPVPTADKIVDVMADTIFKQEKRIAELENHIRGADLSMRINQAISNIEKGLNR